MTGSGSGAPSGPGSDSPNGVGAGDEHGFRIAYRIDFEGSGTATVDVELDRDTLELRAPLPDAPPAWTELATHPCPHCPLDPDTTPRCPAAVALAPLVEIFDGFMSYHRCSLEVRTDERTVAEPDLAAQKALGSLMGLVLAASGCPRTAPLRPMARFHLPLASPEETVYRATSMYMLAQYLRERAGLTPDWTLEGLSRLYADLQVVNRHLSRRLNAVVSTDSPVNAVVSLDVFAAFLPMAIEDSLVELRPYFRSWLEEGLGEGSDPAP